MKGLARGKGTEKQTLALLPPQPERLRGCQGLCGREKKGDVHGSCVAPSCWAAGQARQHLMGQPQAVLQPSPVLPRHGAFPDKLYPEPWGLSYPTAFLLWPGLLLCGSLPQEPGSRAAPAPGLGPPPLASAILWGPGSLLAQPQGPHKPSASSPALAVPGLHRWFPARAVGASPQGWAVLASPGTSPPSPGRLRHPAPSFFLDRGALVRCSGEAPGTWGETLPSLANMSGCSWALPSSSEVFQARPSPSTTCPGALGEAGEVPQAAGTPSAPGGWLRAGWDCPVPGARPSGRCSPATRALSPGPPAHRWPEGVGHAGARWPGQEHGTG